MDNVLTPGDYDRVGGLRSVFATWCDQAYRGIRDGDRATARTVLTSLIHDGDPAHGIPTVRRRRTVSELTALTSGIGAAERVSRVLNYLAGTRVVTVTHDPVAGEPMAELAHDTVIEHWDALQTWLDQAEDRARHWDATGRRRGLLDDDLREASRHQDHGPAPGLVTAYIQASRAGQRAHVRTRHQIQTALVTLTITAPVVAGIAYSQNRQAIYQSQQAVQARNLAVLNQIRAEADQLRTTNAPLATQLDLVLHQLGPTDNDNLTHLINDTQTAQPTVLTGHTDTVWSVAWSPDGHTLASGSVDQTVRLWNVADPAHPAALGQPLTGHTDTVYSMAWSPDGHTLASGSADATARLWNVDAAENYRRICATSLGGLSQDDWTRYIPQYPYAPPCAHQPAAGAK